MDRKAKKKWEKENKEKIVHCQIFKTPNTLF